jgi:hypothetical protein
MAAITDLTSGQLKSIITIKEKIEALQSQIDSLAGGSGVPKPFTTEAPASAKRKYHMTVAHRRKLIKALAKARRIRSAKLNARKAQPKPAKKKDRRSSPAVRAKLAAAAKARWARVKAEGKKGL